MKYIKKKRGYTKEEVIILCLMVAAFVWCLSGPISKIYDRYKIYDSWDKVADNVTLTIKENDAYTTNIKLEKETGTIKSKDITNLIDSIEDTLDGKMTVSKGNTKDVISIEYTVTDPNKTYNIDVVPANEHTVDITFNIKYEDDFDSINYERLTEKDLDDIEELFGRDRLKNKYIIAKYMEDGTFKVKIRPKTK